MKRDPLWYKDAVIYEVHIKSFCDSNGDGMGDFRGLTSKLSYLQDLGVTAIWLLPFYPSPLRDDGYDIADYNAVNDLYGNLDDFKAFLDEAHARDLKVITELVINHTSDQHPWFQAARNAPKGSPEREFYVWSDNPEKYSDVRIIFKDFEASNWTWDPVAKSYFWHRFYSHQPDLNYDNPKVQDAVIAALDFWLKMGVDGLRLDAIPYLFEREGTNCENLPETHAFLKKLRNHVDEKYKNRMLLAEANQWPEEAAHYFGEGDECHMAFHFPMMPRLFMSIHLEDRLPIIEIAEQTPAIPENCQWALFLRNHDELTLEMVTDEERDYMFRVYAHDPQARINLGIRHRLAPLLKNDRRKIELMNSLLFSLTGTPVLYYGDEIGMGDNIYLGDRDGVRTPMQWSSDRNGGFSRANPQRLYLPIIIDPEYHYETINVENQQNNPHSLFWKTRQLINLRKLHLAFSRGATKFLQPENRKILAYFREYEDELLLIVCNLSRFVQYTRLDLSNFQGLQLVELFGRETFPPIEEDPVFFTLGPYAYYWFMVEKPREEKEEVLPKKKKAIRVLPLEIPNEMEILFNIEKREMLTRLIESYLKSCQWFRADVNAVDRITIIDQITLEDPYHLVLVEVIDIKGQRILLQLILQVLFAESIQKESQCDLDRIVARFSKKVNGKKGILYDVTDRKEALATYLNIIRSKGVIKGDAGKIQGVLLEKNKKPSPLIDMSGEGIIIKKNHRSISFSLEEGGIKLLTQLDEGMSVDVEMRRVLYEKTHFRSFLPISGYVEYSSKERGNLALVEIIKSVSSQKDNAWEMAIAEAERFLERAVAEPLSIETPTVGIFELSKQELPEVIHEQMGDFLEVMRRLGECTADFHIALSTIKDDPNFAPSPINRAFMRSFYQNIRKEMIETFLLLRNKIYKLPQEEQDQINALFHYEESILSYIQPILTEEIHFDQMRYHGQYILENLLYTGKEFLILDFEGNPFRSYHERRFKRSVLRDVAAMLYSFFSAGFVAIERQQDRGVIAENQLDDLQEMIKSWTMWMGSSFLRNYLKKTEGTPFIPREHLDYLLSVLMLERMLERLKREVTDRPKRMHIPLKALLLWLPIYCKRGGDEQH